MWARLLKEAAEFCEENYRGIRSESQKNHKKGRGNYTEYYI